MINVEEARNIISSNIHSLDPVNMPLATAFNHVLAENVFSATDVPAFAQSAMDGYAFRFEDLNNQPLTIKGEMAAGATSESSLSPLQAVRIFTGAPVPVNADTVVMQEKTTVNNKQLFIGSSFLRK